MSRNSPGGHSRARGADGVWMPCHAWHSLPQPAHSAKSAEARPLLYSCHSHASIQVVVKPGCPRIPRGLVKSESVWAWKSEF